MDIFTKYNRNQIKDRQMDTLIGLSKGLIADGKVNQAESEFLLTWLIQNQQATDNPIIINLLEKVEVMLEDGVLDTEESAELFGILKKLSGNSSEIGELAKPTNLPLDTPEPSIIFEDKSFLFTGTFAYGNRKHCSAFTESLGGICTNGGVTKKLNFLVLGQYVTDSWVHETYGRKIEKALTYKNEGIPISIISEEHWLKSGEVI